MMTTSANGRRAWSAITVALAGIGPSTRLLLCLSGLALFSLVQYSYTIGNPLIWDAREAVLRDASIHSLSNIPSFFSSRGLPTTDAGEGDTRRLPYYRPLLRSFEAAEYALFGTSATGYHVVNVVLNAAVVVAFFLVLCDLSGNLGLSFAASLLFAVNPARGEAVYWVYGLSNLLMALFVCMALLWYRRGKHVRALLALAAGLLAREDAVLLPLALLLYEYLFGEGETRRRLARTAPYFITVAAYLVLRSAVLGGLPPLTRDIDPIALVNTAAVIAQRYFSLVILPSAPVSVFPREMFAALSVEVLLSYVVLVVYVTGLAVAWRRNKFIAFWLAWGLLWISLWFNVGQFGEYLMTEKGMYLASGGFCVVAASMILRLRGGTALLALITCAHFAVTFTRSTYWRDPVVFFEEAVSSAPHFVTTRYELAMRYLEEGDCGRAITQLERATELNPSHSQALNNLGTCYYMLKEKERAVSFWVRALEADETNAKAAFNLGLASEQAGNVERALAYYRQYLSRIPDPPAEIKRHIHRLESDLISEPLNGGGDEAGRPADPASLGDGSGARPW